MATRTKSAGTARAKSAKSEQGKGAKGKNGHHAKPVTWLDAPEDHDYPAAASYLSLVAGAATVDAAVEALRTAPTIGYKAKDVLRASALPLLPPDNAHVASDLEKIHRGEALSPVLLVRGDARDGRPAQIADGYHRVCASYHTDENTLVTARIVDLPAPR